MYRADCLSPILGFLERVGIPVEVATTGQDGFLPGIRIVAGTLKVDPERLAGSGDLLHEAGHIAVIPSRLRPALGDNVTETLRVALETAAPTAPPTAAPTALSTAAPIEADPALATAVQMGELMAIAWSYAALLELGLPLDCVFFPGSYRAPVDAHPHPMLPMVCSGGHMGVFGLGRVGMTGGSGPFALLVDNGLPPYPRMTRWVQH